MHDSFWRKLLDRTLALQSFSYDGNDVSTQICLVFVPVASDILAASFTTFDLYLYWPKFQRNPISLNAEGNQTLRTCVITVKCHIYNAVHWWKWSVCKVAMAFDASRTKFRASHCVLIMLDEPPCSQLPQTVAPGLLLVTCVGNSDVCHSGYGFLLCIWGRRFESQPWQLHSDARMQEHCCSM